MFTSAVFQYTICTHSLHLPHFHLFLHLFFISSALRYTAPCITMSDVSACNGQGLKMCVHKRHLCLAVTHIENPCPGQSTAHADMVSVRGVRGLIFYQNNPFTTKKITGTANAGSIFSALQSLIFKIPSPELAISTPPTRHSSAIISSEKKEPDRFCAIR